MAASRPIAVPGAAGPVFVAEAPERVRPNVRPIALPAPGHLVVDVNQGSRSAILLACTPPIPGDRA